MTKLEKSLLKELYLSLVSIRNRSEHKYSDPITMQMTLDRIASEANYALKKYEEI